MADRFGDLLAPVEDRLRALERVTREADAVRWSRLCEAEGWPVALVCYHIARGFDRQASFMEGAILGTGPHRYSWDETDALNVRIAGEHPLPTPDDVMTTAREAIERARSVLSRMGQADLGRVAFVNGSFEGSIEWLVRTLIPRHADGHLTSIATALADRRGEVGSSTNSSLPESGSGAARTENA